MKNCELLIYHGIIADCDKRSKKGLGQRIWLIPLQWIDKENIVIEHRVITSLPFSSEAPAGKEFYPVEMAGKTPFNGAKKTLVIGTYFNTWTTELPIKIIKHDDDITVGFIDPIVKGGRYVAIVENITRGGTNGEATFELYGFQSGLQVSEAEHDLYSDDTLGGWSVTLKEEESLTSSFFFAPVVQEASGVDITRKWLNDHTNEAEV